MIITYSSLIRCYSFEEAIDVANLYEFADNIQTRPGHIPFNARKYRKYSEKYHEYGDPNKIFTFCLNDIQQICSYGAYRSVMYHCPAEFHYDASDVIPKNIYGNFLDNNLIGLLPGGDL